MSGNPKHNNNQKQASNKTQATLAVGGSSTWRIYTPASTDDVVLFAASELRDYLRKITGADLPVTKEPGPGYDHTICIGLREDQYIKDLITEDPVIRESISPTPAEGFDGYSVSISPKHIFILGDNGRGALYGVYDLLERIGCRWYHPALDKNDPEVVPRIPDLRLEEASWSAAGKIEFRVFSGSSVIYGIKDDLLLAQIDWAAKNRFNMISWQPDKSGEFAEDELKQMESCGAIAEMNKRGIMLHGPMHSFPAFLPTRRYFDEHPEWFGLMDGKRSPHGGIWPAVNYCWSNDEANEEFIKNVVDFVKRWPIIKVLSIVWVDGGRVCECPKCQEIGGPDLLIGLMNRIADRLEIEAPDVILETVMGYAPIEDLPKGLQPNGKWQGLYAHWGRNHDDTYSDPRYGRRANLLLWASLFDDYQICNYYGDSAHQPITGPPFLKAFEGDTEFMIERGVKGSYILHYPMNFWWNYSFNMSMGGILSYYYPDRRARSELRDYCENYFGPKAGRLLFDFFSMIGDNLPVSYRAGFGNASDEDVLWLRDMVRMIDRAIQMLQESEEDRVFIYRAKKLQASYNILLKWAQSGKILRNIERMAAEIAGAAEPPDTVEITDDEITNRKKQLLEEISKAKAYAEDLYAAARDAEKNYSGTMEADWFNLWYIQRTFTAPIEEIEKRLKKE